MSNFEVKSSRSRLDSGRSERRWDDAKNKNKQEHPAPVNIWTESPARAPNFAARLPDSAPSPVTFTPIRGLHHIAGLQSWLVEIVYVLRGAGRRRFPVIYGTGVLEELTD
jgi:hypothetical protein